MEGSRWMAAVASIWIQCSCGTSYTFGIYSPILKSSQGYDQSTLDTVSVFKDIGSNAGVISGILFSAVSHSPPRFLRGPWVVHAAGVVQCFAGYLFLWLAVTGAIPRQPVAVVCLFMFLAAHSQTFFNTANVVTAVQNFPAYTGTIVGIMMGFLGLSGAILVQVYETLFPDQPTTFLLVLSLTPTLISLLLMFFVQSHETTSSHNEKTYLNWFSLIAVIVAAYVMFVIILENMFILSPLMRASTLAVLFLLLASPLHIAMKANASNSNKWNSPLLINPEEKSVKSNEYVEVPVPELNIAQAMGSMSFWLIFIAMVCGMGSGLATINNMSQIGESLGYSESEKSALVSLWSIWNFVGRVGAGFISDVCLHRKGWARPLFMTLTLAVMTVGHVVLGWGFPGNLYVGSMVVGICYGSLWSLMPTITSEIFGVGHMATIFSTIAIASPLGSYIFSVRVIGYIYDGESGPGNSCFGTHCFMVSFFVMAAVSLFGSLVALGLVVKTRGVYARIVRRRIMLASDNACF